MPALTCPLKGWVAKPHLMKMNHFAVIACLLPAACSQDPSGIRLVQEKQAEANAAVSAKTEPVFYNGKTYQVSLVPAVDGFNSVKIAGMSAKQERDASGLATSALYHFACKDSQKAILQSAPVFVDGEWKTLGHCV